MKLSGFGRLQMNNPARAWTQRHITAKHMLRLGGKTPGGTVLEIGCGRGVGAEILLADLGAARVDAFDRDSTLVQKAQKRLAHQKARVTVRVGDATAIDAPASTYDAVFDFGVIHQIEKWQRAVEECARVLKPGGRFFFEAVTSRWYRMPMNLAMERGSPDVRRIGFSRDSYLKELEDVGIQVGQNFVEPRSPITAAFIGDFIGVGTRNS